MGRLTTTALLTAVILPGRGFQNSAERVSPAGADVGVIKQTNDLGGPLLERRADSPTDVCLRWSHQTALLNGTIYIYGGQSSSQAGQETDTWNNDFLTLDLTRSWDSREPALTRLSQPSGPPAVANGYLWNDYDNLYQYGGIFADNPYVTPSPVTLWKYIIRDREWIEFTDLKTSRGNNSDGGDQAVQRAGEGAGISVPELGLSWYFGGHLDWSTTPTWSNQIARVYLKSLLEFTHPGYSNDGVDSLGASAATDGGVWRNITGGGSQVTDGFPERADGVLVYVPGWGSKGVLVGLAGGSSDTFADDLRILDVYDIASSVWYHQQTTGDAPSVRVNPCSVVTVAPDASSFQIHLFGGQNLQPYREQRQYSDMFILSIPSFIWIKVSQSGDSTPAGRAGHSCNIRDAQLVLVGGYLGEHSGCESSGVFVFNTSSLEWVSSFTALEHVADIYPENSVQAGSYGYRVPEAVARVIGGDAHGGATVTRPVASATGGPFATGTAPVFTVHSTATVTAPGATVTDSHGYPVDASSKDRRTGLIVAGLVAGLAGLLAAYLGFCAWLYHRQVRVYKKHVAIANRYRGVATLFGRKRSTSSLSWRYLRSISSGTTELACPPAEPKPFDKSRSTSGWATSTSTQSGGRPSDSNRPRRSESNASHSSTEGLLDGQEPSFLGVVMSPRRALRVVNGLEGDQDGSRAEQEGPRRTST